ncbi:MAG: diphosphate--fructose-6-phosphate 1-phosphotransferase [Spirochaetales bacterium]|nr:diphosphate--fructose-6-phosphate 1-phosphotransferase [Spirochaetales bacterium]
MELSPLQKERYKYQPKLPTILKSNVEDIQAEFGAATESVADQAAVKALFETTYGTPVVAFKNGSNPNAKNKINVGVILSGGQAPGGHNVIAGLYDGIKAGNKESKLFGFLGGPSGLVDNSCLEITDAIMDEYRNTGGFDIIGSGRTKLEEEAQFDKAIETCNKNGISAVVVIGGDDSNTNAAVMGEYFKKKDAGISVIGCPKTIDGDLKNEHIEASFGFDTATKTYSELIGNIQRDANSAKKYWHFIKLMGRSASHIALECALQTQANICIISEEVEAKKMTLRAIVDNIAEVVAKRSAKGNNFGVALIPEGLIEFIPEMKLLIAQLNDLLAEKEEEFGKIADFAGQKSWLQANLKAENATAFTSLPESIQKQLLLDRDPHGNVQVSLIETEKLLSEMVKEKLDEMKKSGKFAGKFAAQHHFFGYEGRCAFPSNFDADYCYSLGYNAFILIAAGLTGYISSIKNTAHPSEKWLAGGIPLTMMMNMEQRHGKQKPVIKKALVELDAAPFKTFAANRDKWAEETCYLFPGAIQYYGPAEVCDQPTKTLKLEQGLTN